MTGTLNDLLSLIKDFLQGIGLDNKYIQFIISFIAFFFILLLIGNQLRLLIIYLINKRRNNLIAKDLHPFYTAKEVENATKYYIHTQFQNVPPSEDEEPGRHYIAAARQPLIPLFLKKAFKNDSDDTKYYLVLADSGMGKTTFMINLYLSYKFKINWFWQKPKFEIKLFPMGHPNTIQRIKEMSTDEKENCILLLDAFDEDNEAVLNYEGRLKEVMDLVWEFREIVITCRTQFFPSSKSEPVETGKFKFGPKAGQYTFQKVYVSVFSESDIKKYLKKRFRSFLFLRNSSYLKALAIVLKSPNLMMRPMLLSHVEDLIKVDKKIQYGFQIYEALIDQWLNRESNKAGIIEKYGNKYKPLLYKFSRALARDLYSNRAQRNNKLSLNTNEIINNPNGLQLVDIEGNSIGIDKYDQGSRSLLNRNAVGEYKFSHKSILEYFIALEVFTNRAFRATFKFESDIDTAKKFFMEMVKHSGNLRKFNMIKLGFSEDEVKYFISKDYFVKSVDEILKELLGSAVKYSFKFGIISTLSILLIVSFIEKETTLNEYLPDFLEASPILKISLPLINIIVISYSAYRSYNRTKRAIKEVKSDNKKQSHKASH